MNTIKKGDIVRLTTGETCKIMGLPGTFMSNGAYEIINVELTGDGKYVPIVTKRLNDKNVLVDYMEKFWVKPNRIAYNLTVTDHTDTIINYFETIYGEDGDIHIIPKNLSSVELVEDENGFKTIRLHYDGHLHSTVNILIGENNIKNEKKGTT